MKNAVLNTSCVMNTGRSSGWPNTNAAPSRRSCSTRCEGRASRGGSGSPASRTTAHADSAAANAKAGAPPVQPTSAPATAGPDAKATVRASSIRPLAAARAAAGTSAGTRAGAATLYATVPHAPTKPSSASRGSVSRPSGASASTPASASARSASAPAIRRGRDIRSASTPAGTESTRNGSVCAACSRPASPAPAPRASTATMGAAASATCSADCAARLDHARRLKADGSALTKLSVRAPHGHSTPHVAPEFPTRRHLSWFERRLCRAILFERRLCRRNDAEGRHRGARRQACDEGRKGGEAPLRVSAHVERLAQAVADEVDGEHGQREKEAGEEDDPERQLHVRLALGHDVAPRRDVGRRAGAEEGQVGLEQDGRGADVGGLHDEWRHQRRQHVAQQNARRAGAERAD